MPKTPQNAAGRIVEPPVCVPSASGTMPSATAAPEPDDEPPGVRAWSQGLRVGGKRPPQANSSVCVLPRITAPSARSTATQWASSAGGKASGEAALPPAADGPPS